MNSHSPKHQTLPSLPTKVYSVPSIVTMVLSSVSVNLTLSVSANLTLIGTSGKRKNNYQTNKNNEYLFHKIPPVFLFNKLLFLILHFYCFIASFAFVLQRHRAKPIPLCRAGVYSRRLFRFKAFITAGARSRLRARSRSESDTTLWCHSRSSRRFATPPYDVIPL